MTKDEGFVFVFFVCCLCCLSVLLVDFGWRRFLFIGSF